MSESVKVPIGFKCTSCGKIHYPTHARCLKCKQREFEQVNLPNEGTLITYTILKAPPTGINKSSLNLGIVDLGNDVRYTGQLEIPEAKLKTGIKVKAQWQKVRVISGKEMFGFVWTLP